MVMSVMPADLPLPIADDNGIYVPADSAPVSQDPLEGLHAWDPWIDSNLAKMADRSQPSVGPYSEPSGPTAPALTAEWGGMPSPVVDYQNVVGAVAINKRQIKNFQGPTGQFNGPQQTAWEYQYTDPTSDYWSVILG
jgi:hypothetical protein